MAAFRDAYLNAFVFGTFLEGNVVNIDEKGTTKIRGLMLRNDKKSRPWCDGLNGTGRQ